MRSRRIFCNQPLQENSGITLDKEASNHLVRVLRLQANDRVTIFNGQGGEYAGEIVAPDKNHLRITLGKFSASNLESPLEIELGQGISRGERMDYTIRKAVELGVKSITPLLTEHCEVRLDERRTASRLEHWRKIVINACEQCGRNFVPDIAEPVALLTWTEERNFSCAWVLSPGAGESITEKKPPPGLVGLLVGPEGGLSDDEITRVCKTGFTPVHLGPRILRTETAALAAISALQACFGDFR